MKSEVAVRGERRALLAGRAESRYPAPPTSTRSPRRGRRARRGDREPRQAGSLAARAAGDMMMGPSLKDPGVAARDERRALLAVYRAMLPFAAPAPSVSERWGAPRMSRDPGSRCSSPRPRRPRSARGARKEEVVEALPSGRRRPRREPRRSATRAHPRRADAEGTPLSFRKLARWGNDLPTSLVERDRSFNKLSR